MQTFIVGVSAVATASLMVVAKDPEEAEEAAAVWLETHRPEDQPQSSVRTEEWDVEVGSTEVWAKKVPYAIKAAEVLVEA